MNNKLVSVIVTAKNEEKNIGRLLRSIKKQTHPRIEIIVVDNNSTDQTKKVASKFTKKVYNFGPERSAQRNFGAKKASGKFLLFLDSDMKLSPSVIEDCVSSISKDKKIGAVIIPEQSIARTFWEKVKAFERSFYNESEVNISSPAYINGEDNTIEAARFFQKEAYNKAGGYDESITGPEDWDLSETVKDLGYKIGRIKSEIFHYEKISSPISLAKKKFYYALRSHSYIEKRHLSIINPKTIYFFRPVFYKKWKKLISSPILAIAMMVMFIFELGGGGMGYLVGKYKRI